MSDVKTDNQEETKDVEVVVPEINSTNPIPTPEGQNPATVTVSEKDSEKDSDKELEINGTTSTQVRLSPP